MTAMAIPVPPSTETWRPIGHGDLITAVDRQLLVRGIAIETDNVFREMVLGEQDET